MYKKTQYVLSGDKPTLVEIRDYGKPDFPVLIAIQQESFPPPFPPELWWNPEQLTNHVELYPEGALCTEVEGEMVGSITALLSDFNPAQPEHTWQDGTDNGSIRNHNPAGKTLYIVDICIRPKYRSLKLGQLLMQAMYERVVQDDLERLLGGGRMPGFHEFSDRLTAEQYAAQVVAGEIKDPVISFLLRCDRMPICVVVNYLTDEESEGYALLMEWKNPFRHHQQPPNRPNV
ncbi:N-acetyltransferase GCN5 [Planococcus antarcticus DSM 14505]|uniref:GNAT family N-acetyltransferase n=1 Tax=Planococcus antarcticus DSM 14505 TaxID=1185653 RepID=A0A1C7DK61_9BACL|nr:GNAT family N-acetyltransferase [Planococcus antarcticus]ANU11772.1 GNAT family N-acetyltransferase [Planococcus antarcticus DSM 14505]EIM06370.1 N-acetyltransferase GCN5 [Planococcus antarcticus DSM 14505]